MNDFASQSHVEISRQEKLQENTTNEGDKRQSPTTPHDAYGVPSISTCLTPVETQLDKRNYPYIAEGRPQVQFQTSVDIIDARPLAKNLSVSLTAHGIPCVSLVETISINKEKELVTTPTTQMQPITTTTNLASSGNISTAHVSNTTTTDLPRNVNVQTNPQLNQIPMQANFPKISTNFDKAPTFQNKNTTKTKNHHTNTQMLTPKQTTQHTKNHSQTISTSAANTHPNILTSFHIPKHTYSLQLFPNVHQSTQFYSTKLATTLNQTEATAQPPKPTSYPAPSPPTIIHSLVTKLRARHAAEIAPIEFTPPKITTK
ncbi:endochitinase 2-like [Nicotiana tomentosiformis]|uniref:endochitinase 2-like n=1 Tax=Nicotiana tomentosiformis TaxID=4098 RepID=UPI00388C43ED